MLKMYDLICPKCGFEVEELVEYDIDKHEIIEEIICENCAEAQMQPAETRRPKYSKHGSWSEWSVPLRIGS